MTVLVALLAAAAAAIAVLPPAGPGHRLAGLRPQPPARPRELGPAAACAFGGLAVALLVGWPAGLLPGVVVALVGPRLLGRLEPADLRRQRLQLVADLPLVLDLLGACLAGGGVLPDAAAAVAAAVRGPVGVRLQAVVDSLAVGTAPGEAWLALAGDHSDDPVLPVARLLSRAVEGGTPLTGALERMAAESRAVAAAAGAAATRRVGVLVVAPLGLCFLPAFVLLGIVPVVAGLAGPLLGTF